MKNAVILDAYTVEPSGLGVPPYLSTYVRYAYSSLRASGSFDDISYLTIDDFRLASRAAEAGTDDGFSNPYIYSKTVNAQNAIDLLRSADLVVAIAGDAVPSFHLHAVNGSLEELYEAMSYVRGRKILVGPMVTHERHISHTHGNIFDAHHNQTIPSQQPFESSIAPISYEIMDSILCDYSGLIEQIPWSTIAEIELYRGCTRARYCSFCNEPVKNPTVGFRAPELVLNEMTMLYQAGVRHFRLGQQTCFFSYYNRNIDKIKFLLSGIRERMPDIQVLHIDNVDPLAAASKNGRRISELVATYCTEGNAAPMGIETFDQDVVKANNLTCTPEILFRAIEHVQEYGAARGPLGYPKFLAGLNLIYGMPGQTRRTHFTNMEWLLKLLDSGHQCHRTNVRKVRLYEGTPLQLSTKQPAETDPSELDNDFSTWSKDISQLYDIPMKERVYPLGHKLQAMHAFFVDSRGTWYRRLGSYSIQVLEPEAKRELYKQHDLLVTGHTGRYLIGALASPAEALD